MLVLELAEAAAAVAALFFDNKEASGLFPACAFPAFPAPPTLLLLLLLLLLALSLFAAAADAVALG